MKEIRVLLVDDDDEFVTTLQERIKMRDFSADKALSGEQALLFVYNQIPDVMVLDLKMPGIDGMEVLRQMKVDHPEVQVIVVTGYGSVKEEEEARRLGAFKYFHKPVEIDALVNTIKDAYKVRVEISSYSKKMASIISRGD